MSKNKGLYIILFALFLFLPIKNVTACTNSTGESVKDKEVAKEICSIYKDVPYIQQIAVQQTIMYVDITRDFFNAMKLDKISATKLVKRWMSEFKNEINSKVVTVWVYTDKVKVIDGDTSWTGEDKVKFLY